MTHGKGNGQPCCPKCVKPYGHNYAVVLAHVE